MLTSRHIKLKIRVSLLNCLVRSHMTYGCHEWRPTTAELAKLLTAYKKFLRSMVSNGYKRVNQPDPSAEESGTVDWRYVIRDTDLFSITQTDSIESFYTEQQHIWLAHTIRRLALFYKMINGMSPVYTTDPIPPLQQSQYSLRKQDVIGRIRARTQRFQSSFYPSCLSDWNDPCPEIRLAPTIAIFKKKLLSKIHPPAKSVFGIHDPIGLSYLTQLRDLS